jgi:rhodanese-related sulfurtransferase
MPHRPSRLIVMTLIVLVGLLPVFFYWAWIGRAPTITPQEARVQLGDPRGKAVLVDVRTPAEFSAAHLNGAINWPLDSIETLPAATSLPPELEGHELLLICASGGRSARAALTLQTRSDLRAVSVQGGMQEWTALPGPNCPIGIALEATHERGTPVSTSPLPTHAAPAYEQWAAVLTAFGIKPLYMALSLVLIVWIRKQSAPDIVALRWAMIMFLAGESFCALNYLFFNERSYLMEHLHSYGMVLSMGFFAWFMMEAFDSRIVHFSHPSATCAWVPLCQHCIKHKAVPCGLRRLFLLILVPAVLVISLLPLGMALRYNAYSTNILGSAYGYFHPVIHQMFEHRYLPVVALLCGAASWIVLVLFERHPLPISKFLFAAALGAIGFSFFRLLLLAPFADNQVWFVFWEEITELLYVLAVGVALILFRRSLLDKSMVTGGG